MNQELMTAADVSRLEGIGLTPAGVKAAAERGALKIALRTPGGTRLFRRADALRFAAERQARSGSGPTRGGKR
jgi:hypothetical protein